MECPHHGVCRLCKEYCGCSFDPTSMNDYCSFHRPGNKEKGSKAFYRASRLAEKVIAKKPKTELEIWHAVVESALEEPI
jgi:hypothetical protein